MRQTGVIEKIETNFVNGKSCATVILRTKSGDTASTGQQPASVIKPFLLRQGQEVSFEVISGKACNLKQLSTASSAAAPKARVKEKASVVDGTVGVDVTDIKQVAIFDYFPHKVNRWAGLFCAMFLWHLLKPLVDYDGNLRMLAALGGESMPLITGAHLTPYSALPVLLTGLGLALYSAIPSLKKYANLLKTLFLVFVAVSIFEFIVSFQSISDDPIAVAFGDFFTINEGSISLLIGCYIVGIITILSEVKIENP